MIEQHPLTPFLPANGRLLMLGSFPPQQKRWAIDFYYPNFTNDMWRVFGVVFFDNPLHFVDKENKTYRKSEIVDFLNNKGIGIFDAASAVRRLKDNASDKFLDVVTPTNIDDLLHKMPLCKAIATTGQKATDIICERYSIEQPKIGTYREFELNGQSFKFYRMPSTSRAYPLPIAKKAEVYRTMFEEIIGLN